ncbi:wd repeat-containing protein [Anaeramoeba flamelloides]|uniref:Wd repeat-containing protein n=1 Tax=Anaeramoeba flamelloides TaxID=1746091 RepID=A0ABQ8ZD58_9EUKA|nr:wd repeat-containing protein [Anaeramoeba flamelloides]
MQSFSYDNKYWCTVSGSQKVKVWNTHTGRPLLVHSIAGSLSSGITCTCWTKSQRSQSTIENDGFLALGTSDGSIYMLDLNSGELLPPLAKGGSSHSSQVNCLVFDSSLDTLWSCGDDGYIFSWPISAILDQKKTKSKSSSKSKKEQQQINDICKNLKPTQFITENRPIKWISLSPNEEYLLTATEMIFLFEIKTKKHLHTFPGHGMEIKSLRWDKSGTGFYSTAGDLFINFWSLPLKLQKEQNQNQTNNASVFVMDHFPFDLSINKKSSELLAISNGSIALWDQDEIEQDLNDNQTEPKRPNCILLNPGTTNQYIISACFLKGDQILVIHGTWVNPFFEILKYKDDGEYINKIILKKVTFGSTEKKIFLFGKNEEEKEITEREQMEIKGPEELTIAKPKTILSKGDKDMKVEKVDKNYLKNLEKLSQKIRSLNKFEQDKNSLLRIKKMKGINMDQIKNDFIQALENKTDELILTYLYLDQSQSKKIEYFIKELKSELVNQLFKKIVLLLNENPLNLNHLLIWIKPLMLHRISNVYHQDALKDLIYFSTKMRNRLQASESSLKLLGRLEIINTQLAFYQRSENNNVNDKMEEEDLESESGSESESDSDSD